MTFDRPWHHPTTQPVATRARCSYHAVYAFSAPTEDQQMLPEPTKFCLQCGALVSGNRLKLKKYCSNKCRQEYHSDMRKKGKVASMDMSGHPDLEELLYDFTEFLCNHRAVIKDILQPKK